MRARWAQELEAWVVEQEKKGSEPEPQSGQQEKFEAVFNQIV